LLGTAGNDVIDKGRSRLDWNISSGDGNDAIYAGSGRDVIDAGDGDDYVAAGDGNDRVLGGGGQDTIFGGAHNDTIDGGSGSDLLFGGTGDDLLIGGTGTNFLYGEEGNDTYQASGANLEHTGFGIWLDRGFAQSRGVTDYLHDIENATGSQWSDLIVGNGGDNILRGAGGYDTLEGGGGRDTLDGGALDDVLTGGEGSDRFIAAGLAAGGFDVVTDYHYHEGDVIDVAGDSASYRAIQSGADVMILDVAGNAIMQVLNVTLANGIDIL